MMQCGSLELCHWLSWEKYGCRDGYGLANPLLVFSYHTTPCNPGWDECIILYSKILTLAKLPDYTWFHWYSSNNFFNVATNIVSYGWLFSLSMYSYMYILLWFSAAGSSSSVVFTLLSVHVSVYLYIRLLQIFTMFLSSDLYETLTKHLIHKMLVACVDALSCPLCDCAYLLSGAATIRSINLLV